MEAGSQGYMFCMTKQRRECGNMLCQPCFHRQRWMAPSRWSWSTLLCVNNNLTTIFAFCFPKMSIGLRILNFTTGRMRKSRAFEVASLRSFHLLAKNFPVAACSSHGKKATFNPLSPTAQMPRRNLFIQTQDTPNPNSLKFLPGSNPDSSQPCSFPAFFHFNLNQLFCIIIFRQSSDGSRHSQF